MHLRGSNSQESPRNRKTQFFRCALRDGKRTASFYVLTFFLFSAAVLAKAQQHHPRYVYDGITLRVADDTQTDDFVVIVSFDGREATVRFHKNRAGQSWLDSDLEGYVDEGIAVFD